MIYYFDQVDCKIAETGVTAESASVSLENSLNSTPILGSRGVINQFPNGPVRGTFNFSYPLDITSEPCFHIIRDLKENHNNFHYPPKQVVVAGITGSGYLESYSIKISPNDIAEINSSFVTFIPVSGNTNLQPKENLNYNISGYSGLSHGWTTYLPNRKDSQNIPVYQLDYNFKAAWEPTYILGSKLPLQVQFLGAQESLNLTRDIFKNIQFSGESASGFLGYDTDSSIVLLNLESIVRNGPQYRLTFSTSGMQTKNTQLTAELDNYIRIDSSFEGSF